MPLTPAQITALAADIAANTATAPGTQGAIKDLAHTHDNAFAVALWYNLTASPSFFGYYSTVPIAAVRGAIQWKKLTPADAIPTTPALTVQVWQARNDMCQTLQFNLELIMGTQPDGSLDATPNRIVQGFNDALSAVPSGASGVSQDAGWAIPNGVQSVLNRKGTNAEKLFADTTNGSGANNTGTTTGPASFGPFEGAIQPSDINGIWGI